MGLSTAEFYAMNSRHMLSAAEAGLGFVLSVLGAKKYHGQEIAVIQALNDFERCRQAQGGAGESGDAAFPAGEELLRSVAAFEQQYAGWKAMNVFERQWVLRDFKKCMGAPAEQVQKELAEIRRQFLRSQTLNRLHRTLFEKMQGYWKRQFELLQGYEKDRARLAENSAAILAWIEDLETVICGLK